MKLVICVVLFVAVLQATAFEPEDEQKLFPDYWQDDNYGDDIYDYGELQNVDSKESKEKKDEADKSIEAELKDLTGNNQEENNSFSKEDFDPLGDYQFEDNRSNNDNKENDEKQTADVDQPIDAKAAQIPQPEEFKENQEDKDTDTYDEWWNELIEDKNDPLPDLNENMDVSEEAQGSVNEDNSENNEDSYVKSVNEGNVDPHIDQIIEDTKKNLEGNDKFDSNQDIKKSNEDDDTPEKVLEDLSDDLDKLFETLDKLSDNDSDLEDNDKLEEESEEVDSIQDYEEKYKRPHGEGYIMSLRDDYDTFLNSNETSVENAESYNKSELDDQVAQDETTQNEKNNNSVESTNADAEKEQLDSLVVNSDKPNTEVLDKIEKMSSDDDGYNDVDGVSNKHYYGNDGLMDDNLPKNDDAEVFLTESTTKYFEDETASASTIDLSTGNGVENISSSTKQAESEDPTTTEAVTNISTENVDELSSSEYNAKISQFAEEHKDEIFQNSESAKNVVPQHITLRLDEPTIVTSPNHPGNYPANTIVDWIIDGPGMGIEFNLTKCIINGINNDYLLVKPGSSSVEGSDGIIFSFTLSSVRRYRFLNVNRMFVRFQSHGGFMQRQGFSFSAKMIFPPPNTEEAEVPVPEPILERPVETMELKLAGLTLLQFHEVKSNFKELVAQMAQLYIKENNIDPGLNTTLEVTQITRTAICNIRWPDYDSCVDVTFGIPLVYPTPVTKPRLNATDLDTMWRTYIVLEPFASRLRNMGITEYAIPNDSWILTKWLVVASGVVIGMCLLAFALWRFSCFADYTRMKTFSDTDSIQNEKGNHDLYPTPHQTLPPLYTESDYKWADEKYEDSTRVDLGGYANKSYIRDDLFDLDSDEEVIVPHDRKTVISPRDVYDV